MSRQGSASFVIVIGAMTAILIGAIMLTFVVYPISNSFRGSSLMGTAETTAGNRIITYTAGMWEIWGLIIMIGILSFVWIRTRQ